MTDARSCAFEGCDQPAYQRRNWCNRHYFQLYRNGAMGVDKSRAGRTWAHSHGYSIRTADHPLALRRKDGAVYVHRLVLWEMLGPGSHPCHWCGNPVTWAVSHPAPGALEVDHVDGDKGNNASANLVPSCHGCNTRRANGRRRARGAVS